MFWLTHGSHKRSVIKLWFTASYDEQLMVIILVIFPCLKSVLVFTVVWSIYIILFSKKFKKSTLFFFCLFFLPFVCHIQTPPACTIVANTVCLVCNIIPIIHHKRKLLIFCLVEIALKAPAACCPHSPSPVTAPGSWETNSVDPSRSLFPGFSSSSPALSTCVSGSILYIPDMLQVSMDHIHHVCRLSTDICWAFPFSYFHIYYQARDSSVQEPNVWSSTAYVGFELVWNRTFCVWLLNFSTSSPTKHQEWPPPPRAYLQ